MLDVYSFYKDLVFQLGEQAGNVYFDNWFRFWLACGDDYTKNLSFDRYYMFHHLK